MENNTRSQLLTIPGAIIIAGALIAIAVVWTTKPAPAPVQRTADNPQLTDVNMKPITSADHILGNPQAPIKIVEYSDPSCPYCKQFDPVMHQVMVKYGADGNVAWVYRHFPLDKPDPQGRILHPNAGHESQALECAAFVGGNDKFWAYEKAWYDTFPLQGATQRTVAEDTTQLAQIAKDVGLDAVKFNDCLSSGQMKSIVDAGYTDGINAGVPGTPYTIIITPSGSKIPLSNGYSLQIITSAVDALLSEIK